MAPKAPIRPCLDALAKQENPDKRNRLLLAWLSDDDDRAALFTLINACGGSLEFDSRCAEDTQPCCPSNEQPRPPPVIGHKKARLVTCRKTIEEALLDGGTRYSSRPYGELGGGKFMLALDPATKGAEAHAAQMKALCHSFPHSADLLARVGHHACQSAAVLSLRAQNFDLAEFSEQTGLRFCQSLFGYARSDHP